jgi:N-acetylglucosamine-6-sulfatase
VSANKELCRIKEKLALFAAPACLAALFLFVGCSGSETSSSQASQGEGTGEVPLTEQPNLLFILADDLDYASAQKMPQIRSRLVDEGASFEKAFVSYPLCCPSRATILTGLYAHNHSVTTNEPPTGGFQKFLSEGHEENTIATSLQQNGYTTGLFGKYLNEYPGDNPTHVPPGWNEWHATALTAEEEIDTSPEEDNSSGKGGTAEGHTRYYDYRLNENGEIVPYGDSSEDYLTDVLSKKATDFVRHAASGSKPFFLYLAPAAPHDPATPAERHKEAFEDEMPPRSPSFDEEDVTDKPSWIGNIRRIGKRQVSKLEARYRERLRSMLAVDEMVASLIQELRDTGELDNTFIFFTSDNGFLLGEHRVKEGKVYPYEESIRTPLFIRGPGVPAGAKVKKLVLNTDMAPPFPELAGVSFSADGRSFAPLLYDEDPSWRSSSLLEAAGSGAPPTYAGIRTETHKYVEYANGKEELYDLESDPYELESVHESADPSLLEDLKAKLDALKSCYEERCREAEDAP